MFQTHICFLKNLFLSLTRLINQFYLDFLDPWDIFLSNTNVCLKTFYKTYSCLKLHNWYMSYKTDPHIYLLISHKYMLSALCSGFNPARVSIYCTIYYKLSWGTFSFANWISLSVMSVLNCFVALTCLSTEVEKISWYSAPFLMMCFRDQHIMSSSIVSLCGCSSQSLHWSLVYILPKSLIIPRIVFVFSANRSSISSLFMLGADM